MSKAPEAHQAVLVNELAAEKGIIGYLSLNAPKSLNSLTLEMVQALYQALEAWKDNKDVSLVLLNGQGEKAFCAGGDVQKLYQSAVDQPGGPCEYAEQFFAEEYQLNYLIHTYPKPIVCIGTGIVMGGGLGLMAGASHRIVDRSTRIAMPEISIGLFPDVGGTRFLNAMPNALGIFFALTGASINANDAIYLKLADHFVDLENTDQILTSLTQISWFKDSNKNRALLDKALNELCTADSEIDPIVPSQLSACVAALETACRESSLGDIVYALERTELDNAWFNKAMKAFNAGSPLSALLIFEQLRRFRYANLETSFQAELNLATNIVRYPEFTEGVRALLIDKDKKPKWAFEHFSHVPASLMDNFFSSPWNEDAHPLSGLGH